MIEKYPEIALERFDKATFWIKYFVFIIKKFMKDDILEVGAGCGSFTKGYMKNFQSITLTDTDDNSFNLLKKNFINKKEVNVIKSKVKDINKKFNTLLYFNVLEHVEKDKQEITDALEKLNEGGHLIILVPAHQRIYSKLDKAVGHYKRYEINFFKENTFKNSQIIKLHYLDFFGYALYHLNKIFFKDETYPTSLKIFIWDKIFTPLTTIADFFTGYKFGKNILCIYKKTS
jgi:2-polyprenyl-3-methyl-5-hydroxy-6-metoxy-1,4-benzoquinol methylase